MLKAIEDDVEVSGLTFENSFPRTGVVGSTGKPKVAKNPLLIPEILDCCFEYLNLSDVKNCRRVCLQWSIIGEPFIRKLSSVIFIIPSIFKSVETFNNVFEKSHTNQKFTSVQLRNVNEYNSHLFLLWPLKEFKAFFEDWRDNLKELTMNNIDLNDERGIKLMTYDMSTLLPSTLTKLVCEGYFCRMTFSLGQLPSVKVLRLRYCTLNIESGKYITPVELDLDKVQFRQDGEKCEDRVLINDFILFSKLKKAKFVDNLSLDMQGEVCLDSLDLSGIYLINLESSKWKVKEKLSTNYISLTETNQIEYKELKFRNFTIDPSVISNTVEKLTLQFDHGIYSHVVGESSVYLPKLKHLSLVNNIPEDMSGCLRLFKEHCPNLTNLNLSVDSENNHITTVTISSIPPSVTKLCLTGFIHLSQDSYFEVDTLILRCCTGTDRPIEVTAKVHAKKLVWEFSPDEDSDTDKLSILDDNLKGMIFELMAEDSIETIVCGPFIIEDHATFDTSEISLFVDTQGEFYQFKDYEGKAIGRMTFDTLADI